MKQVRRGSRKAVATRSTPTLDSPQRGTWVLERNSAQAMNPLRTRLNSVGIAVCSIRRKRRCRSDSFMWVAPADGLANRRSAERLPDYTSRLGASRPTAAGVLHAELDQPGAKSRAAHAETRDSDGQVEAPRAGAARIQIEDAVPDRPGWAVGVTRDHGREVG